MTDIPTADAGGAISDERLDRLIAAYGKMSFEKSYADIVSALRELKALRRPDTERQAVVEACVEIADSYAASALRLLTGEKLAGAHQASTGIAGKIRSLSAPKAGEGR